MGVTGVVFEIREFCLHDGPGIRTTVFFKGCPLRCPWCHNPESWQPTPQPMLVAGEKRICGRVVVVEEVARRILLDREMLSEGGVTFSGGEPLAQPAFLLELCKRLKPLHLAIETSGFASPEVYRQMLEAVDLVYQDVKCALPQLHRQLTGVENALILQNLAQLQTSGRPYIVRIPIVPGVNDSDANLEATADLLASRPGNLRAVELLPYHAGGLAKHHALGTIPPPMSLAATPNPRVEDFFQKRNLPVKSLSLSSSR